MSRGPVVVARAGAAACALGLLLLAFVAYQIWGTALYESQAQARLRRQLSRELGHGTGHAARDAAGPDGSSGPASRP
ncbi:MAG: hypothetical protein ACRDZR_10135, partial [Acidimicrobiales bacterium]